MTENTCTTVETGQNWKKRNSPVWWVVVSISADGMVGLSGPGPARSMKYISIDDLEQEWEQVV